MSKISTIKINHTYNYWKVVGAPKPMQRKIACECLLCGTQTSVDYLRLLNGKSKWCGCDTPVNTNRCNTCNDPMSLRRKEGHCKSCYQEVYYNQNRRSKRITKKSSVLPGKVYGHWQVIEDLNTSDHVLCLCTGCGNTQRKIGYSSLTAGQTRHCGCRFKRKSHWEYRKERHRVDESSRLAYNLRARLHTALKRRKQEKVGSHIKELGCTCRELVLYLESQFQDEMSWNNYGIGHGKWNIDHIQPLVSFDLTDRQQLKEACHYTNLQPMWAVENSRKGGKING